MENDKPKRMKTGKIDSKIGKEINLSNFKFLE